MQLCERRLAAVIALVNALTFSALANAGWVQGFVVRLYSGPQMGNAVAVKFTISDPAYPREGRPACAIYDEFAFDSSTPGGQQVYAMLLQSQRQTGSQLFEVYGAGTCTVTGDREDVRFIYMCFPAEFAHGCVQ